MVTAHQADHVQADNSAALQREAALVEEKGQLKLALTIALEQKASTSGALADAEGRLQEATQQVCGLWQNSCPQDCKPTYRSHPLPGNGCYYTLPRRIGRCCGPYPKLKMSTVRGSHAPDAEALLGCLQLGDSQEALAQQRTATEAATSQQQQLTERLQDAQQQVADLEAAQQAVAHQAAEKAAKLAHLEGDRGRTHKDALSMLTACWVRTAVPSDQPQPMCHACWGALGRAHRSTHCLTLIPVGSCSRKLMLCLAAAACLQAQAQAFGGRHGSSRHLPERPGAAAPTLGCSLASHTLCTAAVPGACALPHAAPGRLCSTPMLSSPSGP